MADDVRRWSDELARDPASLVFLQLGEALRRQGQHDLALKIAMRGLERHSHNADAHDLLARICVDRGELQRAFDEWDMVLRLTPAHIGALKGMAFVRYQQGNTDEAEKYLRRAAEQGGDAEVAAAMGRLKDAGRGTRGAEIPAMSSEESARPASRAANPTDSRALFADILGEHEQTALLLDDQGLVLAGMYLGENGSDVGAEVGAELSGVTESARRAARHLDIGDWRAIVLETEVAVVTMGPSAGDGLLLVAASKATPLGLVRRVLDRCLERARAWLRGAR